MGRGKESGGGRKTLSIQDCMLRVRLVEMNHIQSFSVSLSPTSNSGVEGHSTMTSACNQLGKKSLFQSE